MGMTVASVGLLGLGLEMDVAESGGHQNGHSTNVLNLGGLLGGFFRRLLPDNE